MDLKARKNHTKLKYKKFSNISIYGGFSGNRIEKLKRLRDFLRNHDYNARISEDFEEENPIMEDEDRDSYNIRMSKLLADWGEIHIFIFFYEYEGESNVNQSASMEFKDLMNSRCVIIFFERDRNLKENSFEQMKSYFRGCVKESGFDYDVFEEIEDIFDDVITFCHSCL